jgi:integrase
MTETIAYGQQSVDSSAKPKRKDKTRKSGMNRNREGSVRKVNGKVYVDFIYMGERVRESSGLFWNEENVREVRDQLDRVTVSVKSGGFRFAEVFPKSKKADYFTEKERLLRGERKKPDQVTFQSYGESWYLRLRKSGRVEPRTLWGYSSYLKNYLYPFFGQMTFSKLNKAALDEFVSWANQKEYRGKCLSNNTVNKIFVPLKMICKDAAIEYGWGESYNPFFGYKKLTETDPYEALEPFSAEEQDKIIQCLPDHWKPYFLFAFCTGLRQGEQIGIKPDDIDWPKMTLRISRAITRDENGRIMEGKTKNRHSRRTIPLIPVMVEALQMQKQVYERFNGTYFFCSATGERIRPSNLRRRVWIPALKKAGVKYREMKQTRHSFATNALSCGENPLWIAKVMGHRDTDMIIRVYGKYIENASGVTDGTKLEAMYRRESGKN